MKISELADQVRGVPLREVLEHYGFEIRPEGTTLRARSEHHNIVVTGGRWFDNKAGLGGGGAIDLVIHLAKVNFSAACRSLANEFLDSQQVRQRFPFLRAGQSLRIRRRNPLRNSRQSTRCGTIPTGRLARAYLVEQRKISRPIGGRIARSRLDLRQRSSAQSKPCFPSSRPARQGARSQPSRYQTSVRIPSVPWK